ncbi:MAG: hypothetical protein ACTSXJ_05430 [Candidatus Baldrarchaeia archaeon]
MAVILIGEEVKRELLRIVSELQIKLGRRVTLDEAIWFLLMYRRRKNPRLLLEACKPVSSDIADKALRELYRERRRDERRLELLW